MTGGAVYEVQNYITLPQPHSVDIFLQELIVVLSDVIDYHCPLYMGI